MKIHCLTTFLDGQRLFEKDEVRSVSDEDGARFCANGWAKDASGETNTGEPAAADTSLDIHNSTAGHASSTVGG